MGNENRKIDRKRGSFYRSIMEPKFSQEKWAELLNVSARTVGYYYSGEREPGFWRQMMIFQIIGGLKAEDIPS
ncbi:MAG: hypothetical protein E7585_00015 [Ruminococcaceae bacterium]|nr:hypothetical protein [Oscillospiraceae bacterium]